MLILSRKVGESTIIGEGPNAVVMTIVEVKGSQVRVGWSAPKNVPIMRSELLPNPPKQQTREAVNP